MANQKRLASFATLRNVFVLFFVISIATGMSFAGSWRKLRPTVTASSSGTTIPPASQIVDSQNAVWTVSSGYIYRNGTQVPSANVILLLYYNGIVYQENSSLKWWAWINGAWATSSDPRPQTVTPISLTTSSLPSAGVSRAYSATLTATGGTSPYTWSVVSGFMGAGLSLSSNGVISGTPTTAGSNTFSVQVKDSGTSQQAATSTFTLTVANVPPSVATIGLPIANVNAAYSTALSGTGGSTPYTWTLASGSLPNGLSLSDAGSISGTPTASGTFALGVRLTDATGATASASLSLTVAAASSSTGFQKFYASTSFWNTPIPSTAATDPNSANMMQQSVLNYLSQHITFSNGGYGMPLAYAKSTDKVYNVKCTGTTTTTCAVGSTVAFPIPAGATPATGTDHHLVVAYTAMDGSKYAGKELDIWEASYDSANDVWSGNGVAINDLNGWGAGCALGQSCENSNVAAGYAGLGGAVRPEEIAQGHIDHALAMATPYNRTGTYFACPATHMDSINGSSTALPEGAQLQLDPTFNVDAQSWPQWVKVIAKAMQTYGVYNRDFAGVVVIYGVTDANAGVPSWSSVGVPTDQYGALDVIPWNLVRVINITACHN